MQSLQTESEVQKRVHNQHNHSASCYNQTVGYLIILRTIQVNPQA